MARDWSRFGLLIRPTQSWVPLRLDELWAYRELLFFLAWRDIKVRYSQTVLGILWAVIQPVFTMVVFTVFFGRLGGMEHKLQGGIPYAVFTFTGLVPWGFFAHSLTSASTSLVGSAHLVKKVYFPRLVIPLAGTVSGVVDFCVAFVVLLGLMAFYGIVPTVAVLWLPGFILLTVVTALGVGLWLSALNAQFRDVQYTLGFLAQFWLFVTPIAYPSTLVPERWQALYGLNPMAGVVDGFRWALLGGQPPGKVALVSAVAAVALLVSGAFYFRRTERLFADTV